MKSLHLSKTISLAALSLSLMALPFAGSASAQDVPSGGTTTTSVDDGPDWGWVGLLGLIGLAGLTGRKRDDVNQYRDPHISTETQFRR